MTIQNAVCALRMALFSSLLLLGYGLQAQVTVSPFVSPAVQFSDNVGAPLAGGKVCTYSAGTSTPLATYSDLGITQNQNPVVLDAGGRATIYLQAQSYKIVIAAATADNSCNPAIKTQDNVSWATIATTLANLTVTGNTNVQASAAATSGANQNSPNLCADGNYWTGSASAQDSWCWKDTLGTGANPTSTLILTHSGSSGAAAVTLPTLTSVTTTGAISGATALDGVTLTPNPKDQFNNPTTTVLGLGDPLAVAQASSTCCNAELVIGINPTTWKSGNTAVWGECFANAGAYTNNAVCEGITGQTTTLGAITTAVGSQSGALIGGEFDATTESTSGNAQILNFLGVLGQIEGLGASNNLNATYAAGLESGIVSNAGTGMWTGGFGLITRPPSSGNVKYGIWNQFNHLTNNGDSIDWMYAATTSTSSTMTGCPSSCLVTVTDTAHGYSTNDFVFNGSGNVQYQGFYQITVTGANTFTYVPMTQASNAANDGSAQISKLHTAHTISVDGNNSLVLRMLTNTASGNGAFALLRGDGSVILQYNSPTLFFDPGNAGHAFQFSTSAGFNFGGGTAVNGTTGSSHNLVLDTGATLTTPTFNSITSGKGLQIFNTTTTCTTGNTVGATCTTGAISLPVAETDTAYRVVCTGKGLTNVPVVIATANSSASQFTITIAALTAAAASFASYDCIAGHN